jgi:hypothetical protein
MGVLHRAGLLALTIAGAALIPLQARAGLIGSELGWQYYGGGGPYDPSTPGSQTSGSFTDTGSGVGGTFIEPVDSNVLPVFNIDADDTTVTFDYSVDTAPGPWSTSPLSLAPTIYNGVAVNLLSAGSFTAVTIDPATNMVSFNAADLSFTGEQIQIDWHGLAFNTSTIVKLDVTYSTAGAAPEPGSGALMLLALGVGFLRQRRRGRSTAA